MGGSALLGPGLTGQPMTCKTETSGPLDGPPPKLPPGQTPAQGGAFLPSPEGGGPLILTDETNLDRLPRSIERVRGDLLARWERLRPVVVEVHGVDTWERVRGCLATSYADRTVCPCCGRTRFWLRGVCQSRVCLVCRLRYPRKKARELAPFLLRGSWVGSYVVTTPHEIGEQWGPARGTELLGKVAKSVEKAFRPVMPAGAVVVHWRGDRDPRTPHVHFHCLWGSLAEYKGEAVSIPGPTLSSELLERLRNLTGAALGVSESDRQGHYEYRTGEDETRHTLRYNLRPQGCGDDEECVRLTPPGARSLRPFGMLATGRRKRWASILGITGEPEHHSIDRTKPHHCPCTWGKHRAARD